MRRESRVRWGCGIVVVEVVMVCGLWFVVVVVVAAVVAAS